MARARTGSGKTLAYILPALHGLAAAGPRAAAAGWQVLVLVPTRELVEQARAGGGGGEGRFWAAGAGSGGRQAREAPPRASRTLLAPPQPPPPPFISLLGL